MAIGNSIFSGRICDALYTNPEHDTVEVLYRKVAPDEPSGTDAEIKKEFYLKKGNIETYKIKTHMVSHYVVVDENDKIVGTLHPSKIIHTVFGGRKNNN